MYKRTAKASHRNMMKRTEYASSLATLHDKHDRSQWSPQTINRGTMSAKKRRKKFGNFIFGKRFR